MQLLRDKDDLLLYLGDELPLLRDFAPQQQNHKLDVAALWSNQTQIFIEDRVASWLEVLENVLLVD